MRIRWRGFELPSLVAVDPVSGDKGYGKFVVEPFERGFGNTVANGLRRVLLSSLEGASVTQVRIAGAQHEFCSLPGVIEDVTEICLNLKSLVFRHSGSGCKVVRIDRHCRGVVTGADIVCDDQVSVVNTELVLATLTDDVPFCVEISVELGRGYLPASERYGTVSEPGVIALDASFSPVVRVRHKIEDTRVGQRTNFDRVVLEIWTNETVSPVGALVEAAKILRKHLGPFINARESGCEVEPDGGLRGISDASGYIPVDLELEEKLCMSLAELNLSVRATNCLESEGISTVRDLVNKSEDQLLQVRNFGETTLCEVRERLTIIGLRLGMRVGRNSKSR